MAAVSTDVSAMQAAAGHVENVNGQMQTIIGQLRADAEGIGSSWQGTAAASFHTLMARYDESSRKLQQVLADIADNIRKNGVGYDSREQDNLHSLNHAASGGGLDVGPGLNIQS